jgi:hypothetical protein
MFVTGSTWCWRKQCTQLSCACVAPEKPTTGFARRGARRRLGCQALVAKSDLTGWKDWLSGGWPGGEAGFFKWLDSGGEDDVPYLEPDKQPRASKSGARSSSNNAAARSDAAAPRSNSTAASTPPQGGRVVTKLVTNPVTGRITLEYVVEDDENNTK